MKKSLENELMSLAHRILQLKEKEDLETLKKMAGEVYEKLSILSFAEKHFAGPQPTIGKKAIEEVLEREAVSASTQKEESKNTDKSISKQREDTLSAKKEEPKKVIKKKAPAKNDLDEFSVHYDDLPQFEPAAKKAPQSEKKAEPKTDDLFSGNNQSSAQKKGQTVTDIEKPKTKNDIKSQTQKSLNERLKGGLKLGLNDRIAFTKHLFEGNSEDFNRVISQLNTLENFDDAKSFIEENIKPEYDWKEEEEFEERFYELIEKGMDVS